MISVVTVNYKTKDYVEKMLESLFLYHEKSKVEVFIVENGSGEDLSDLEVKYPSVKFIISEVNRGFAGGCNLAINEASGDYILLVNPDIIFTSDSIYQIEKKMNDNPEVGVGGIGLKNLDGSTQACVWRFPKPLNQLVLLTKLHHVFSNIKPIKKWLMKDFDYSKTQDVDQVMGAFFCIRKEVIEQIGLLDDGFFIWYEEVDFCKRTVDAGWYVRYFSEISAKHKKGSSFERVATMKKQNILRKSIRRYIRKHHGVIWWFIFLILEPVFFILSVVASLAKLI